MSFSRVRNVATLLLALTLSQAAGAQQTARLLSFEDPVRDLGTIKEADGKETVRFEFTNIADTEVTIVDVYTQCGCASPHFSKSPVKPGGKGVVTVTLDPEGRFGDFKYGLTVTATNGEYNKYSTLVVKGHCINRIPIDHINYPAALGESLRADIPAIGMRKIKRGESRTRTMKIYNTSADVIQLSYNPKSHFLIMKGPARIEPGQQIEVEFLLNSRFMPEGEFTIPSVLGAGSEEIVIEVKGTVDP